MQALFDESAAAGEACAEEDSSASSVNSLGELEEELELAESE
jgi:hypothetical protein